MVSLINLNYETENILSLLEISYYIRLKGRGERYITAKGNKIEGKEGK